MTLGIRNITGYLKKFWWLPRVLLVMYILLSPLNQVTAANSDFIIRDGELTKYMGRE